MQTVAVLNMGAAGAHACLAQSHGASVSVKLQQVTGAPEAEHTLPWHNNPLPVNI